MELTDSVVLVTGSKRIGARVAEDVARRGADVALVYHSSRAEAEAAADRIRRQGRRSFTIEADLRNVDACHAVVEQTVAALGRLDVLVNMASVYTPRSFADLTLDDWNASMEVDLRASWLCARAAVPHMRRAGRGRIINFSDWLAPSRRPRYRSFLPYYVAKAAVVALTEALALELAADQILVNAVAPGPILAPLDMSERTLAEVEKATPLGRWGGEAEIAKAVLALIETDFITGETLRVDGGRHLK
jgi:NAD(P)-dependent dehydrogenase (short-subunit alcohol dehydrogenase family)